MADQSKPMPYDESSAPKSRQIVKSLVAATIGAALELLSGLSFAGAVIVLAVATPLLVIFSPILVPAGIALFLIISGFFLSGGCGVVAVTVLTWMYKYVTGGHPPGADKLDSLMEKISNKAGQMKNKAKMQGQHGQFIQIGL